MLEDKLNKLNEKTLLLLGDSIMYGSGNGGVGVGEFLERDCKISLVKLCIGGARVGYYPDKNWLIDQVKKAVEQKICPDLIIFDGFTNDCNMTDGVNCDVPLGERTKTNVDIFDIDKEKTNFTECFEALTNAFDKYFPKAKVIFVRPHNMGRRDRILQKIYGDRANEICLEHNIYLADIYSIGELNTFDEKMRDEYTCDSYGWGRGDATHPNAKGYEKFYMPVIEKIISEI
jgi:lysophospholipase L1-like esterase